MFRIRDPQESHRLLRIAISQRRLLRTADANITSGIQQLGRGRSASLRLLYRRQLRRGLHQPDAGACLRSRKSILGCPVEESSRRKLNLGIVCHPAYGGSGVVASELGLELAARGHHVHFFSHSLPFRVPDAHPNTFFHEVEVTSYPLFKYPPYTLALATKLAEVCRKQPLDVIHVHYAIPHAVAAWLCTQMLPPEQRPATITTLHGTDITLVGLDNSFFEITRFSLDRSDGITAVSDQLAGETLQQLTSVWAEQAEAQPDASPPAVRALENVCHGLLNSAEFVYID